MIWRWWVGSCLPGSLHMITHVHHRRRRCERCDGTQHSLRSESSSDKISCYNSCLLSRPHASFLAQIKQLALLGYLERWWIDAGERLFRLKLASHSRPTRLCLPISRNQTKRMRNRMNASNSSVICTISPGLSENEDIHASVRAHIFSSSSSSCCCWGESESIDWMLLEQNGIEYDRSRKNTHEFLLSSCRRR
jgi:hypothetical protein